MPSQKWRKKSEHSRKNATFADYFERVYQHFLWITSCLAMTQIASTIKQLNNQTVNN